MRSTDLTVKTWRWCMSLAQRCNNMRQLKAIQAIFIACGLHQNNYAISKLLSFCALSATGSISYASLIFTQIHGPNFFIYNTLIRAYSRSPYPHLALHYFHLLLCDSSLRPDHHTFTFVLMACAKTSNATLGRQVHNWVVKNSLASSDSHVQTSLIMFYSDCKSMDGARKVFDEICKLDVVQCNVLINGYLRFGLVSEALRVFRNMLLWKVEPDEFCVTTGLTACAHLGALEQGKWIHEFVKKRNRLASDVFVGTALVNLYAKCGCIDMAVEVFERMPKRNVFSWATIIGGFAVHGYARQAINFLERMHVEDGLRPDGVVLLGVLTACSHAGLCEEGQFVLDSMEAQYGVVPQHEHYSCMVDLLSRAGQLDEALRLTKRMPMKPLASVWSALLSGCRIHNNVDLAEFAVKELLLISSGNRTEEDGTFVQLSNIYLAVQRREDAIRTRRLIGDRGLKKTPGCSMIEVNGEANEFVSGDVSHPQRAEIHAMLDLISLGLSDPKTAIRNLQLLQC